MEDKNCRGPRKTPRSVRDAVRAGRGVVAQFDGKLHVGGGNLPQLAVLLLSIVETVGARTKPSVKNVIVSGGFGCEDCGPMFSETFGHFLA